MCQSADACFFLREAAASEGGRGAAQAGAGEEEAAAAQCESGRSFSLVVICSDSQTDAKMCCFFRPGIPVNLPLPSMFMSLLKKTLLGNKLHITPACISVLTQIKPTHTGTLGQQEV